MAQKPYLAPLFDEPEFAVRNLWRVNGGWYDGVPSHLKPASEAEQAREIAELTGGFERLLERALSRMQSGDLALACHLIDWAASAAPQEARVHEARAHIYAARAAESASTLSYRIFNAAAQESASKAGISIPQSDRRF